MGELHLDPLHPYHPQRPTPAAQLGFPQGYRGTAGIFLNNDTFRVTVSDPLAAETIVPFTWVTTHGDGSKGERNLLPGWRSRTRTVSPTCRLEFLALRRLLACLFRRCRVPDVSTWGIDCSSHRGWCGMTSATFRLMHRALGDTPLVECGVSR